MKRFLLFVFVGLLLGQNLYAQDPQYIERYNIYLTSDTHFQTPYIGYHSANPDTGRQRLAAIFTEYINKDPLAACFIHAGDWLWNSNTERNEYLRAVFQDTARVPIIPTIGNHEDDIGYTGGEVYNDFIENMYPGWFEVYEDQDSQGRTWFSYRPKLGDLPVNMVVYSINNVADEMHADDEEYSDLGAAPADGNSRNYTTENPYGYGWANYDYPGIRDPNSYQRKYFTNAFRSVEERDWVFCTQHRPVRYTGSIDIRYPVEGATSRGGYVWDIVNNTNKAVVMFQGDEHTNTWFNLENGYYTFAASWNLRGQDYEVIHRQQKDPLMYIYSIKDTDPSYTYIYATNKSVTGLLESIDPDISLNGVHWSTILKMEVYGTEAVMKLLMFESGSEATPTVLDSVRISQCACANIN